MKIRMILLIGLLGLLLACGPRPVAEPVAPEVVKPSLVEVAKEEWKTEWEKTLKAARGEGKVSIYATMTAQPIRTQAKRFKEKFGLDIEVTTGRGTEIREKFFREKAAGIDIADVLLSGSNTMFLYKQAGFTEPMRPSLILPEVIDPKLWYGGNELPWGDEDKHIISFFASPNRDIHINADMVRPMEIKSWYDLLDPKWRGKIIWNDPTVTGSGFNGFSTLLYHGVLDMDFYRQMVSRQQIQLTRDMRLLVDWLARGKFSVGISAESAPVAEYEKAGANLAPVAVKEGTYVSSSGGNISIVNRGPHPNAAKVFVNWLLSKEGQTFISNEVLLPSAREDVPTGDIDPLKLRKAEEKYYSSANSIEKWVIKEQDRYLQMAKEVFGPLLR